MIFFLSNFKTLVHSFPNVFEYTSKEKAFKTLTKCLTCPCMLEETDTVKPVHVVTSIKQSPVLKGHHFLFLS